MDNPYHAPEPGTPSRHNFRSLWQQLLRCPNCDRMTVKAGQAWLKYPRRNIGCEACRHQSRITLDGAVWWKYWSLWLVPMAVCLIESLLFKWFEADGAFLNRLIQFELWVDWTPASWLLLCIWVLLTMFVAIAPIVVSFLWVASINLRMIANDAILTPAVGTSCSHETRAE